MIREISRKKNGSHETGTVKITVVAVTGIEPVTLRV